MTDAAVPDRPGFHLVEPSPWPLVGAAFGFLTAFGLILFMHGSSFGPGLLTIGVAGILFTMAGWWRDVVSEAQGGYHNIIVRHGLTFGMILFIASEVMFFVAWFWAFFWNALNPADPQTYGLLDFSGGIWPPKGTEVINPLALPLMNTFVLLTSSAAVNVAHDELREGNRRKFKIFLALGIALGVLFVFTQAYEYIHAPFSFKNSIYGATFFMATGFHGAHVIIGVIFLFVCLMRALQGPVHSNSTTSGSSSPPGTGISSTWSGCSCSPASTSGDPGARRSNRRRDRGQPRDEMAEPLENVRAGMTGRHEVVVTRELTVGAHLDGMPFVFGTPMMILAMEMASAAAAAPHLPAGWVTVGSEVNVRHLAPTPVGRTVVATARVLEVSGRCHAARGRSA